MNDFEKSRREIAYVERQSAILQKLENMNMYTQDIMEFANYIIPSLPYGIWFDEMGVKRKNPHAIPRVKIIMPNQDLIPVSIHSNPKILLKGSQLAKANDKLTGGKKKDMFGFISRNHKLMLQHWSGDITTVVLFKSLK